MKVIIQTPNKEVRIKGIRTQIGFMPEGTKEITENGKYDVFNYAEANVDIKNRLDSIVRLTTGTFEEVNDG